MNTMIPIRQLAVRFSNKPSADFLPFPAAALNGEMGAESTEHALYIRIVVVKVQGLPLMFEDPSQKRLACQK